MADAPAWVLDRTDWPKGPWDEEPDDFVTWSACAGDVPLVALRNELGAWCGYAGVRRGHPLFRVPREKLSSLPSHGGITYAAGFVFEVVDPELAVRFGGEPTWWIGFDCAHGFDIVPFIHGLLRRHLAAKKTRLPHSRVLYENDPGYQYRTLAYVRGRCEALAHRLVELSRGMS